MAWQVHIREIKKDMFILRYIFVGLILSGSVLGVTEPAKSEQPLGKFGDWEAFTEREGKGTFCYTASAATQARGNYKKRGPTYVIVTHRPRDKSTNVISIEAGYVYRENAEVEIIIGKQTFKLFTSGTNAFAPDSKTDNALVKAMIRGAGMTVKGRSSRGTLTTDTYSLKGFTASYKAISAACKV